MNSNATADLIEAGVASRSDYDAARDRFDQAKIALQTARANLESQRIAVKESIERANLQKIAVQEAKTGIRSSEMRASQQQALLRGQSSQRSKATQFRRSMALSLTSRLASVNTPSPNYQLRR